MPFIFIFWLAEHKLIVVKIRLDPVSASLTFSSNPGETCINAHLSSEKKHETKKVDVGGLTVGSCFSGLINNSCILPDHLIH